LTIKKVAKATRALAKPRYVYEALQPTYATIRTISEENPAPKYEPVFIRELAVDLNLFGK
jgi:hypothetical protein